MFIIILFLLILSLTALYVVYTKIIKKQYRNTFFKGSANQLYYYDANGKLFSGGYCTGTINCPSGCNSALQLSACDSEKYAAKIGNMPILDFKICNPSKLPPANDPRINDPRTKPS